MAGKSEIFEKGEPTGLLLTLLEGRFGVPTVGAIIRYLEISEVIGVGYPSPRWWTVVKSWRNKLFREHKVVLGPIPTSHFIVLDPHLRIDHSSRKQQSGFRCQKKAAAVAASTNRAGLTPDEISTASHIVMVAGAYEAALSTRPKKLDFEQGMVRTRSR